MYFSWVKPMRDMQFQLGDGLYLVSDQSQRGEQAGSDDTADRWGSVCGTTWRVHQESTWTRPDQPQLWW